MQHRKGEELMMHNTQLEQALAIKTPVMEAEFAMDDRSAISLYDCLVPKLREHRRFRIKPDERFSIADFKAQVHIR